MKSTPFNPETDLPPIPFDELLCKSAASLKAAGLPWKPHVGCFVWDRDEHIYGHDHHCHLRCLDCGQVLEFSEETIKDVEQGVGEHYDFLVTGHKLDVYGYCTKCRVHR